MKSNELFTHVLFLRAFYRTGTILGMLSLDDQNRGMPKVERHVHLEGAIQPATLLALARRRAIALPALPAHTVAGLRAWCTFTAFTHYPTKGLAFADQLAALNRARAWTAAEWGVSLGLVIDIERVISADDPRQVADWAIGAHGQGVVALGLGGPEAGHPPERYAAAFERARAARLPRVPQAGETAGPASIWGALRSLPADRLGHGVRCLEDPALVAELHARQLPLEVCPTSHVCLHVVPSWPAHMLPRLLAGS